MAVGLIDVSTTKARFNIAKSFITHNKCTTDFHPKDSSTYKNLNSAFHGIYGSLTADGNYFTDTVQVGSVSIPNQQLAQIYRQTGTFAGQRADGSFTLDGIMGAGFGETGPTIPMELYNNKYIPEPIFSVYLGQLGGSAGSVIFGGIHDNKSLNVTNVRERNDKWYSAATKLSVDGDTIVSYNNGVYWLLDTGTSTSRLPKAEADKLTTKLFGNDAVYNGVIYIIRNCSKYLSQSWTIKLTFPNVNGDGEFDLEFTPQDALTKRGDGQTCIFGFGTADHRILGNSVLQRYVQVFNFDKKTAGFTLK